MRLVVAGLVAALGCCAQTAFADFADGTRAMQRGDHAAAVKEFLPLAEAGDVGSQFELSRIYTLGRNGVPADLVQARRWSEAAAEQGHTAAQYNLGLMYERGDGGPRDTDKARLWLERAAAQQYDPARRALGRIAVTDAIRRGDYRAAFRDALPLAEAGDAVMQTAVAMMYRDGQGVATDRAAWLRWIDTAVAQNYAPAQFLLGAVYESGNGRPMNLDAAKTYYQRAAAQNYDPARQALARLGAQPSPPNQPPAVAAVPPTPSAPQPAAPRNDSPPQPRPITAESVLFGAPANFKLAAQSQRGTQLTSEYTPVAESAQNWSQMLTIIISGGVKDTKPETTIERVAALWRSYCANMPPVTPQTWTEGGYPVAQATFECLDPKPQEPALRAVVKKHERMMMKVLQGRDNLYIVQRAWHSDTDPKPKGVGAMDVDVEWNAFFARVEICDSRVPGRLPCPALAGNQPTPAPAVAGAPARPNAPTPSTPNGPSFGTGFVVSKAGHILTNNHVVERCETVQVRQAGDAAVSATLVARDASNDLALLKLGQPKYSVAPFRLDRPVRAGDAVVAYGFPLPGGLTSQGNLTTGSVSALAGPRDDTRLLQITAPVQPGNSGGPLLDSAGNVVGVVTSKLNALAVALVTGDVPQNVNFAIKDYVVRSFLEVNAIPFETAASPRRLEPSDIGDRARKFTVQVECRR